MTKSHSILFLFAMAVLLPACTPTTAQRGNMLEDHQVQQIAPGVHSKIDVLKLLGSPTTQAPFDENIWYYLGQNTEKSGIFDPRVTKERIVIVAFNEDGTVRTVQDVDPNRIDVPIESAVTVTRGNEPTIVQQFLGNIGRFNTDKNK